MLFKYKHFLLLSLFCGFTVAIYAAAVDESKQPSSFVAGLDEFNAVYKQLVIRAIKRDYNAELIQLKAICEDRYLQIFPERLFNRCRYLSIQVSGKRIFESEESYKQRLIAVLQSHMDDEIKTNHVKFHARAEQVLLKYGAELRQATVEHLALLGLKEVFSSSEQCKKEVGATSFFEKSYRCDLADKSFYLRVFLMLVCNRNLRDGAIDLFQHELTGHNIEFDAYKRRFQENYFL